MRIVLSIIVTALVANCSGGQRQTDQPDIKLFGQQYHSPAYEAVIKQAQLVNTPGNMQVKTVILDPTGIKKKFPSFLKTKTNDFYISRFPTEKVDSNELRKLRSEGWKTRTSKQNPDGTYTIILER